MSAPILTVPLAPGQVYPADLVLVSPSFDQRVRKGVGDECWVWHGRTNDGGYGRLVIGKHEFLAHRVAYQFVYGTIARKLKVCHSCDNPPCVRPDHLFAGTTANNNADMWAKGRGVVNGPSLPGESNPQAELTEPEVRLIRRLVAMGIPQNVIAKAAGVTFQHVSDIVKGKKWGHVA